MKLLFLCCIAKTLGFSLENVFYCAMKKIRLNVKNNFQKYFIK